jgi:ribosome-associated translation inhibitor RaiA
MDFHVELAGFKELEPSAREVIDKMIRRYSEHFAKKCAKFESLKIRMKKVHGQEHSENHELHAMLIDNGTQYTASITERDIFTAVDAVLKKLQNELGK